MLRQVRLPLYTPQDCIAAYPMKVTDDMLCAGYDFGGKDACQVLYNTIEFQIKINI